MFQARVYLLSAGFSLAFGSMFAKTYRVHRIFTRTGSIFKDKMLQDTQLISLVGGLLLLDGLVVTLWVATDPMERHLSNLTLEISSIDRSVVYQPQVRSYISNCIWFCVCVCVSGQCAYKSMSFCNCFLPCQLLLVDVDFYITFPFNRKTSLKSTT